MPRCHILATVLCLLVGPTAIGQDTDSQNAPETVRFAGQNWVIKAADARVEEHLGRTSLALKGGRVWGDDVEFSDGVISFDVAYEEAVVFIGAVWRAQAQNRYEEMYFRGHLNNKPDALQYTPVENTLSAWQIFSDENAIAPVAQKFDAWNNVKIVVQGDRADLYFNSEQPVLHVPDLKTDLRTGSIALRSSGRGSGFTYFSNVIIRPLKAGEGIVGQAKPSPPLPSGLISSWRVSSPFSEAEVAETLLLDTSMTKQLTWSSLSVESNGIANLAKLGDGLNGADTVFVRFSVRSDSARLTELKFGYSDRVRIYVNGKRVYFGNAGWRVRDYRFLGTVGFFDAVALDLKQGDNEVLIAISETFGGWAWAGAIANRAGISF